MINFVHIQTKKKPPENVSNEEEGPNFTILCLQDLPRSETRTESSPLDHRSKDLPDGHKYKC